MLDIGRLIPAMEAFMLDGSMRGAAEANIVMSPDVLAEYRDIVTTKFTFGGHDVAPLSVYEFQGRDIYVIPGKGLLGVVRESPDA